MLLIYGRLCTRLMVFEIVALLLLLGLFHSQPLPNLGTGFDLCAVPCWLGIEPGRTAYADAPDILTNQFPEASLFYFNSYMQVHAPPVDVVGVLGRHNNQRVGSIRLNAIQPLWATVLLLGTPVCLEFVNRQHSPGLMNIYWIIDDISMMANVNIKRRNPYIQTNILQISVDTNDLNCAAGDDRLPWPGFVTLIRGNGER